MKNIDLYFFSRAKEISKRGDHRCKIGCVIVHKGNIISEGFNQKFNFNDFYCRYNPVKALHAEAMAILRLKNKQILKYSQIYIYRENFHGDKAICRPCATCIRVLKSFGLVTIFYIDWMGTFQKEILN